MVGGAGARRAGTSYVELDTDSTGCSTTSSERFPDGPPSLREAERLVVHGDVTFGAA